VNLQTVLYTEPARLYGYALTTLAIVALIVAAILSGDWSTVTPILVGLAIAGPAATEATRAAVVSPATADKEVGIATGLATGGLIPQTPGVADHAAPE